MGMGWQHGIELIAKAYTKIRDEKLWQMWLTKYPTYTTETFKPFSEFVSEHTRQEEPPPSSDDLLENAKKIRETIEAKHGDI